MLMILSYCLFLNTRCSGRRISLSTLVSNRPPIPPSIYGTASCCRLYFRDQRLALTSGNGCQQRGKRRNCSEQYRGMCRKNEFRLKVPFSEFSTHCPSILAHSSSIDDPLICLYVAVNPSSYSIVLSVSVS
ncbi:hypothetical protein C8R42DRAFT_690855 [Lentinula raphanica]|nr:hypothetical protein C8R42DRAFT_690855 [Lentinula raphanica]